MRPRTEWLILPLFAIPLLLALGLHLWASAAHEHDLDVYRVGGRSRLAAMTAPDGPGVAFIVDWKSRPALIGVHRKFIPVRVGDRTHFRVAMAGLDVKRWNFAGTFPAGLSPTALADAETRMQIESGKSPQSLSATDEPTRALVGLMAQPSEAALRVAQLPAETKRYIAEHWLKTHDETWMRAVVTLARAVEYIVPSLPEKLSPGYHRIAGFEVEVPVNGPMAFPLRDIGLPPRRVAVDSGNEEVTLWFSKDPPGAPGEGIWSRGASNTILWSERRNAPLAGWWTFTRRGGEPWWQSTRFKPWVGPGIAVLLLLLGIPTALWFALRKRRKLDEARTRFINELAHDLRTPLTSLRLHAEMLGSGRTPEDRRPHYLGLIERESSRLSSLLTNLLDLSRLEGTKASLHPEQLRVSSVVDQAAQAFVAVHPDRRDDVTKSGDPEATIRADAAAIARVLGNLLENAGKFTEAGTSVRISWVASGDTVELTLADDGPGIPQAERRTIFDRYARGTAAKKDGVSGSGLGLALVKELTTRMEGSIKLQPSATGTTFRIRLPRGDHV